MKRSSNFPALLESFFTQANLTRLRETGAV